MIRIAIGLVLIGLFILGFLSSRSHFPPPSAEDMVGFLLLLVLPGILLIRDGVRRLRDVERHRDLGSTSLAEAETPPASSEGVEVIVICDLKPYAGELPDQCERRISEYIKYVSENVQTSYSEYICDYKCSYAPKEDTYVVLFKWTVSERSLAQEIGDCTRNSWHQLAWKA